MKVQVLRVLVAVLLLGSAGTAQSLTELMQKAIYTQDTLGDVPAAIRIYQQIIASAPPASPLRAQAQRRLEAAQERLLQAAEAQRRTAAAARELGTVVGFGFVVGTTYRHIRTGLTFEVPEGWRVNSTYPSSDNGEMVAMTTAPPRTFAYVWMIKESNDWDSIGKKLDQSPNWKAKARLESEFQAYRLREANRTVIGGQQAMVAIADYTDETGAMAEYMTWIYTQDTRAFFFTRVRADELDRLRPQFDRLIYSAIVP